MTALRPALAIAGVAFSLASHAATLTWYSDRPTWDAAVGAPSYSEDFQGFASDQSFRSAPVALNGMSIAQEGTNALQFRNLVEVPPLEFTDNGGTSHASMFTNFGATFVRIAFDSAMAAFGGETWLDTVREGARVEVYDGATLLGSQLLGGADGAFFGFTVTGGSATSVRFASASEVAGTAGEGFGLDNLVARTASVPEPGALPLLGLGLAALAAGFRRRQVGRQ